MTAARTLLPFVLSAPLCAQEGLGVRDATFLPEPPPAEASPVTGTPRPRVSELIELEIGEECRTYRKGGEPCDLTEGMRRLFFDAVEEGLDRLEPWAPGLVSEIVEGVRGCRLGLRCEGEWNALGAYYRYQILWIPREIVIPRAAFMAYHGMLESGRCAAGEKWTARRREHPHYAQFGASWPDAGDYDAKKGLFHEFLHFAGVEQLAAHKRVGWEEEFLNGRQLDRVIACSALAYPMATRYVARESDRKTFVITAQSCATCAGWDSPMAERCFETFPRGPEPVLPGSGGGREDRD